MATKTSQGSESREVMDVDWNTVAEPLDVTVTRNGAKVPRRKVRVRGIVGDDWLEQEAVLDRGAVRRLVAAIRKLARHGSKTAPCNASSGASSRGGIRPERSVLRRFPRGHSSGGSQK